MPNSRSVLDGAEQAAVPGEKGSLAGPDHRLWSIQYLRAFAATAVIAFHLLPGVPLMWLGEHGVDLFFVISGFMMAIMTIGRETRPGIFFLDRITRVVPLYWLATLLTFAGALADIPLFAASVDPRLLLRSLFFIPSYRDHGPIWPTLFLGWTLNYEMFFYIIFAVCLIRSRNWRLPSLSVVLCGLVLSGIIFQPHGALLQTWTEPLLLEFVAGAWLGAIFGPRNDSPMSAYKTVLILAISLFLLASGILMPRLLFGGLSTMLVAAGLFAERRGLLPRMAALKQLGDASYSIYLFQAFAFEAVDRSLAVAAARSGLNLNLIRYSAPLSFAAAIGLGCLVSTFIERPGTAWLRQRAKKTRPVRKRLS